MNCSLAFFLRVLTFWAGASLTALNAAAQTGEPIRLGMIEAFSGPFANTGEAVARNLLFAIERVNARGGVKLAGGARPLQLADLRFQGPGRRSADRCSGARSTRAVPFVLQGNSSAVAAALIDTVDKWNARMPDRARALSELLGRRPCIDQRALQLRGTSASMRMSRCAWRRWSRLSRADRSVAAVYLLNQDYSFGQQVAANARSMLGERAPRVAIVGDELHPVGRIRDFSPYIAKIKASGADTVVTGNWGNDLTLLVRAAREAGLAVNFYTFYGNGLGAPAAIGEAGVGRVRAVAEWHPNATPVVDGTRVSRSFAPAFPIRATTISRPAPS